MKINILLPTFGPSGGTRVLYELGNRLDTSHDIVFYYPLVHPERFQKGPNSPDEVLRTILAAASRATEDVGWFELVPQIRKVLSFDSWYRPVLRHQIRDADATVATSWPTAYTVADLPASKGQPLYFMQHYEIWPLWRNESCWERAAMSGDNPSLAMCDLDPDDPQLARYKALVDDSYSLPLDIIRTSEWEATVLDRLGESAFGAVTPGVNQEMYEPAASADRVGVLSLYRGATEKGDDEALAVFRALAPKYPAVDFRMFGTERPRELPPAVQFIKNPSQARVRELYSMSDVLLYTSWVEGFGLPPLEAMATRNALVSTAVGAVPQYAPESGVEFVPIRDIKTPIAVLRTLLDDTSRIPPMKEANFEHSRQYSWDGMAREFEDLVRA